MRERLVVVGGGILGAMHAWHGRRNGYEVVHLERDAAARSASLRNFGLVWVSGRSSGPELDLALRARALWDEVGADVPAMGLRAGGSLTVALDDDEWTALQAAGALPDAERRGFHLLEPAEVRARNPAVLGKVHGGLWCSKDGLVEPRLASAAIAAHLATDDLYTWRPDTAMVEVRPHGVRDDRGTWWDGDLVVVCPGAAHNGVFAPWLREGVRRVRLQMMQTEPLVRQLTTTIADVDSLRYYPAYSGIDLDKVPAQPEVAAQARMQLLMVQRLDGSLTIGDTHAYDEPFAIDVVEAPYDHLRSKAEAILGTELPRTYRRWAGVYSQAIDGALYTRRDVTRGVVLVTGAGGRGMTCSPAIAAETFDSREQR